MSKAFMLPTESVARLVSTILQSGQHQVLLGLVLSIMLELDNEPSHPSDQSGI